MILWIQQFIENTHRKKPTKFLFGRIIFIITSSNEQLWSFIQRRNN